MEIGGFDYFIKIINKVRLPGQGRIIKKKEIRDREIWMKQFKSYLPSFAEKSYWSPTFSVELDPDKLPWIISADLDTSLGTSNDG